jgi:hypothetical protein
VSQLYDARLAIEKKIQTDGLNAADVKGKIGLKSGKLLALITATSPDDPVVLAKLRQAAKEVLNLNL